MSREQLLLTMLLLTEMLVALCESESLVSFWPFFALESDAIQRGAELALQAEGQEWKKCSSFPNIEQHPSCIHIECLLAIPHFHHFFSPSFFHHFSFNTVVMTLAW